MSDVAFIGRSVGLNNAVDPVNLKTGQLAVAVNVDIDANGRISRRRGTTRKLADNAHSIWADGGECLYVARNGAQDALYRLNSDYTRTGLRSGITNSCYMSFQRIGDKVYYANGFETGIVSVGGASNPWVPSDYVGPETNREFSGPPQGAHLLALYGGRMLVASGSNIWFSEIMSYSQFRLSAGYMMMYGRITMVQPVAGGVFVGDQSGTYFLSGEDIATATKKKVSSAVPVMGTNCVDYDGAFEYGDGRYPPTRPVALWTSNRGIHYGDSSGREGLITEDRLVLPTAMFGGAAIIDGKYIATLHE